MFYQSNFYFIQNDKDGVHMRQYITNRQRTVWKPEIQLRLRLVSLLACCPLLVVLEENKHSTLLGMT